jgi:hypothetical protein
MKYSEHLLLILVLAACGGGEATATGDTSSSDGTGPSACTPGYEACACMAGACLDGLVCLSDLCVAPVDVDTGPGESSGPGTTDTPTTATSDDGSSSTDAPSSTESSSTTAPSGDDESSSGGSSETTMAPPECLEGDNYCLDAELQTCVGGVWQQSSCADACALTGYLSPGCASADACLCEGYADEVCYDGAYNLCICADIDFDIPCTDEQLQIFFDECIGEVNTYVECFADYPIDEVADCAPAEDACL